jgi:murein DD-endopeptidase MepM/ murein hydrolase activator NlpD
MKTRVRRDRRVAAALAACTAIGFGLGWTLRGHPPQPARPERASIAEPAATDLNAPAARPVEAPGRPAPTTGTARPGNEIAELRDRHLRVPIDGADVAAFKGQFASPRDAGGRPHEAVDILAPRNTPIHAVDDGSIAKLFFSKGGGGITIYQFDPTGAFCYYYAHLDRYAEHLHDGDRVTRGEVIGFVGTSGNAPPNTPHLHFAIFELGPDHRWWQGAPIDPYLVYASDR